jgi:hypothetical protein
MSNLDINLRFVFDTDGNSTKLSDIKVSSDSQVNTLTDLKAYTGESGSIVETKGYWSAGDNGHGKYLIVTTLLPGEAADDGYIVLLNNLKYAKLLHQGKIDARQYGVKFNDNNADATENTNRLNKFFKMFGKARLYVSGGIAVINGTLFLKGKWRQDSPTGLHDSSLTTLEFDNGTIRYNGTAGGCWMFLYRHFCSRITGLSLCRTSVDAYLDMTMMWHNEFHNFDIKGDLCTNKDTSILPEVVEEYSIMGNKWKRGYVVSGNLKMHINNSAQGKPIYTNSNYFENVYFFSNNRDYVAEFHGGVTFQNIVFSECDLSYAKKSLFYFNYTGKVADGCAIRISDCYLDTAIPYTTDFDFKNWRIIVDGTIESQNVNQDSFLFLEDYLRQYRLGTFGPTAEIIPTMEFNLFKNGDFYCTNTLASPGWISNTPKVLYSWKKGNSSPSGNILVAEYTYDPAQLNINTYFYGVPAPFTGVYTAGIRIKKIQGKCKIQLGLANKYHTIDISNVPNGKDLVITTIGASARITERVAESMSVTIMNTGTENVILEYSEVFLVPGLVARFGVPLHPSAQVFRKNSGTATLYGSGPTSFTIAHGLYAVPKFYDVREASASAGTAGISYVTADDKNLTLYFKQAPTGSFSVVWKAEI